MILISQSQGPRISHTGTSLQIFSLQISFQISFQISL